jgi:hypothetical protein
MEERSRKRLWEDYVFHFLQKVPPEQVDKRRHSVVPDVCDLADAMLAAHDSRWKKPPEPRTITMRSDLRAGQSTRVSPGTQNRE